MKPKKNSGGGSRVIVCPCGWRCEGDPLKMDTIIRLHYKKCTEVTEPYVPSKEKFLPQDKCVKKTVLGNNQRYVESSFDVTEDFIKKNLK